MAEPSFEASVAEARERKRKHNDEDTLQRLRSNVVERQKVTARAAAAVAAREREASHRFAMGKQMLQEARCKKNW